MCMLRLVALSVLALLLCACQSAAPRLTNQQQHDLDGQLILAAYGADHDEVVRLLAAGADPNAQAGERAEIWFGETHDGHWYGPIGSRRWTPLLACLSNWETPRDDSSHYPICVALLDAGANLDTADSHGATALYKAIGRHNNEAAYLLIRRGADVNTQTRFYIDSPEGSPLWLAIHDENRPMVDALIAAGVVIDSDEVMWEAVKSKDDWILHALIDAGADVNVTKTYPHGAEDGGESVHSLLLEAIKQHPDYSENDNIQTLIRAGATIGDPGKVDASRAYRHAMEDPVLVNLLVEAGVSPTQLDEEGMSPLHCAAGGYGFYFIEDSSNCLAVMLEAEGLDVDVRDADGHTPLYHAIERSNLDSMRMLLEAGADPNGEASPGESYLYLASYSFSDDPLAAAAILLVYGADPLAVEGDGKTMLEYAESLQSDRWALYVALIRAAAEVREAE